MTSPVKQAAHYYARSGYLLFAAVIAISGDAACGSTSPLDFALLVSTFTGQLGSGAITAGIMDVAADILKAEVRTLLSTVLCCNILFCEGELCSEPGGDHPSQVITIHCQQSTGFHS